jgi:phage tail sheath protein FI
MAFQVSPGVEVKEIDATNVVPAVSTSIGGFVGAFTSGPVNQVVTVGSEKDLAEVFGKPDDDTAKYFLTAASFLAYGNALKVVRVAGSGADNATASGTAADIPNEDDYAPVAGSVWIARKQGASGNSLKVEIAGPSGFATMTAAGSFDSAPGTSEYATNLGKASAGDEIHVAVIDEDGVITGTPNTVLETFAFVSQASDAKKTDGSTNYYKNVINTKSQYIYWGSHATELTDGGDALSVTTTYVDPGLVSSPLSGGTTDNAVGTSDLQAGYDLLEDADTIDVNLLFGCADADGSDVMAKYLIAIAEARKDCVAFVSPPIEDSVSGGVSAIANIKGWADGLPSSSYGVTDSSAVYVYDKYNDVYRWIGASGHTAGLCANTDRVADAWFSPAGMTRGQLRNVVKLAVNPKKADRDTLYKARINPLVAFPGEGIQMFGDKTLQAKPSAFDRINVRRLFIVLEKAIATAAKASLFEFNDEFTRAQFRNMVEPFLRDVKGRRGLTDFLVVCDETNNTGQVIDSNSFVCDMYIKPARSINFITLNFIATRTGVEFSEIAGS